MRSGAEQTFRRHPAYFRFAARVAVLVGHYVLPKTANSSQFKNYLLNRRGRIIKYKIRVQITVTIPTTLSSIGSLSRSVMIPPGKSICNRIMSKSGNANYCSEVQGAIWLCRERVWPNEKRRPTNERKPPLLI